MHEGFIYSATLAWNIACKIVMKGKYFNIVTHELIKSELRKSLFILQSKEHDTEWYPSNINISEISTRS